MTTHHRIPEKPALTASSSITSTRGGLLQRKCAFVSPPCMPVLTRNLAMGAGNDPREQEADQVAELVLALPVHAGFDNVPRRTHCFTGQRAKHTDSAPSIVDRALASPGSQLEPKLMADMSQRFGHDFGHVRVHTDALAADSARAVNAMAYTVGHDIVFEPNRYRPDRLDGRRLLAHELTHVVQQETGAGVKLMRKKNDACPEGRTPDLDYSKLAQQVNEGIDYIWGTDEERVYRALRALHRDPRHICMLKKVYERDFEANLLEEIHGDFSDGELEYALQLLNSGKLESDERVQAAPLTYSGFVADAHRLRAAADYIWGTDEEAIFAVLTPLAGRPGMRSLEKAYRDEFGHTIREMLIDEMSDSELDYAIELIDLPMETAAEGKQREESTEELSREDPEIAKWVAEAYKILAQKGLSLELWWERDGNGIAGWDERYWEFKEEKAYVEQTIKKEDLKLTLRPGIDPHTAVDALFEDQDHWKMDCGQFVEIVRLFVQRKRLPNNAAFDAWAKDQDLALHTHAPESLRLARFVRKAPDGIPDDKWKTAPTGRIDVISEQRMLDLAPAGSRIRWTSAWTVQAADVAQDFDRDVVHRAWFAFQHENTIKIGQDRYGAHGFGEPGPFPAEIIISEMVDATRSALSAVHGVTKRGKQLSDLPYNASDADIRSRIFVSQVEYYRWQS